MSEPDAQGTGVDTSVPHSARIWNHWLGGKDNYPVDRAAGDSYSASFPGIVDIAQTSRYFLVRSIRFLAGEMGIRQFLDVGTGLPTVDNTHEVAQRVAPESRVVYVDNDPLVLAHATALLTSAPEGTTAYIDADLEQPEQILEIAGRTLDFGRPVALILSGILGHVADDEHARDLVRRLMAPMVPGSCLSLNEGADTDPVYAAAQEAYNNSGAVPYHLRSPERITRFFDGLELVEPGVVTVPQWRPDVVPLRDDPQKIGQYGGVAVKP